MTGRGEVDVITGWGGGDGAGREGYDDGAGRAGCGDGAARRGKGQKARRGPGSVVGRPGRRGNLPPEGLPWPSSSLVGELMDQRPDVPGSMHHSTFYSSGS